MSGDAQFLGAGSQCTVRNSVGIPFPRSFDSAEHQIMAEQQAMNCLAHSIQIGQRQGSWIRVCFVLCLSNINISGFFVLFSFATNNEFTDSRKVEDRAAA